MKLSDKLYKYMKANDCYHSLHTKDMVMIARYVDDKKFEVKKDIPELKKFYNIVSKHQKNELQKICYEIIERYLRSPMTLFICGSKLPDFRICNNNYFKRFLIIMIIYFNEYNLISKSEFNTLLKIARKVFVKTYPNILCPIEGYKDWYETVV